MANRPARGARVQVSNTAQVSYTVQVSYTAQVSNTAQVSDTDLVAVRGVAWLPYLIVLAGVAAGLFVAWQGSPYAGRGAALVGGSLLAAAAARLVLPPRFAGAGRRGAGPWT